MKTLLLLCTCFVGFTLSGQIPNYVIDDTFNSGNFYIQGGINSILVHDNGQLLVVGTFTNNSEAHNYSMINENGNVVIANALSSIGVGGNSNHFYLDKYLTCGDHLYLINGSLSADQSFEVEYQKSAYNGFLGNNILDVVVTPDNNILVGGRFFTDSINHNNIESLRQLCLVDSTGAPDPNFPMLRCAAPFDAQIYGMDTLSDGSLIVSGTFEELGGYQYNLVGKLNLDFSVDTTFVNSFESGCTAFVEYIDSQDRIYVGIYSLASSCLLNAANDSIRLVRLLPNGEVDPDFNIPILNMYQEDFGDYIGTVFDILELPDGRFLFTSGNGFVNGFPTKGLFLCEDDGTIIQESSFTNWGADDATWGTFSSLPQVTVVRLLDDDKILVGGRFSSFGGEPYNCLVRLKPDGFVGIDTKEGRGKLKLYPNPAQSFVTIELPQSNAIITQIEILTIQGKVVRHVQNFKQADKLSIAGLVAGIYIVTARTDTGVFTQKLVVE